MSKFYETSVADLRIRIAEVEDTPLILQFIKDLAEYEGMLSQVVATEELLEVTLFGKKQAEVIIGEYKGEPVGFALYYHSYSTFLGKANLFLDDLFVKPKARGIGTGKALLACLAQIAVEQDCGRLEWWCLDWNEPSIRFYKQMGAKPMEDWTTYRVDGDVLPALAARL
ncbi:MAG TPA: GNAT family N-acetyltransferase [Anaerovoracaceae bacterium]|nr:GNAT family N-acetyltransferase [Anaerovoracaceae bacterium]